MRRTIRVFSTIAIGLLVASGVVLLASSDPARATFPGQIGRIAFQSNRVTRDNPEGDYEIYKMNRDGSDIKQLTSNSTMDSAASYSPYGKKITFVRYVGGSTEDPYAEISEIYVMNSDGSNKSRLTNNQVRDVYPVFSSGGKKIYFATYRDGNSEIYKMNADGSGTPRNLTNHPAYDADTAFSPDGQIAFVSDRDGNFEVYTMNADGSNQQNRTKNPAWDAYPDFSPNGEQITFHSDRDGSFDVFKMNSDGTGQINLTQGASSQGATGPTFSPSGKKIVFQSDRGSNTEIYKMNADGSNPTRLTDNLGEDGYSDWQPLTAKSRSLTVHQPDTGGPSLLLVACVLLFSGGVMFYAGLNRRM
jgi:Tol biopolymer transport system component